MTVNATETIVLNFQTIPLPRQINDLKGADFVINNATSIVCTDPNAVVNRNAQLLADYILECSGLKLPVITSGKLPKQHYIRLALSNKLAGDNKERYAIDVHSNHISITAATDEGLFRAVQTLRKAIPFNQETAELRVKPQQIIDEPRMTYRGMHLDCARHFFPVEFVKKYLDMMVLHGMNRFHWHLTDDQGWRVEIKAYPLLTEVGSKRPSTVIGRNSDVQDGVPHEGFYTQEEIREIVEYARERYIEVIPEIDMPGHMLAAMAAYPELGCTGGPYEVGQYWGVYSDILCAGKPQVYTFVERVLDEICQLFPAEYIHIGGDEAPKQRWQECPLCQKKMDEEQLYATKDTPREELLQGFFTTHVQQYLAQKGKRIIGWDELLGCAVDQSATIMSWRGGENTLLAARLGHDVIVAPNKNLYFDFYQTKDTWNEPLLIGGCSTVEDIYHLQLIPDHLTSEEQAHIIGFQANLWTEYIASASLAEYQVLPRMAALCELQWNYNRQEPYAGFLARLDYFRQLYEHYGWNYARHLWPEEYRRLAKTFG